jgi:hypothetical protein
LQPTSTSDPPANPSHNTRASYRFNSFEEASKEAAVSRMYGGIHYKPACDNGMVQGKALGAFIVEKIKTRREDLATK